MNNITPENIDQLIVRCLAKEAEPQEIAALQQWIRQDAQNERYYDEMLFIYEQSAKINHIRPVDVDAAWAKVRTGIALTETKV
ncbi:MAG TPA: hypothetical protein VL947_01830, partial [Cytophagales bacterium]|nr:hypothetical protein [Cytophagales bacterium]